MIDSLNSITASPPHYLTASPTGGRPRPRLRPRQAAARSRLAEAVGEEHLRSSGLAVHGELRAAGGEEGAVDAEWPAHRARWHGEDERVHEVPPRQDDLAVARDDALLHGAERVAAALELRVHYRQRLVGKRLVQHDLDVALEIARDARIVGIHARLPRQGAFDEQSVPLSRGRPQHAPVAGAVHDRLAAVLRQADERGVT